MAKGLTVKQQKFVDAYIQLNGNATQAAIQAGYAKKSAGPNADKLLKNMKIAEALASRMKELEDAAIISDTEALKNISEIGRGKRKESQAVTKRVAHEMELTGEDGEPYTRLVYEDEVEIVKLPPRNADVLKANELIGKYYSLWNDRADLNVNLTPVFHDDVPMDDDPPADGGDQS